MPITANLAFRLKPLAGQAFPRNDIGANETFTGTVPTLVDRGSGDYAWQFSSGDALCTLPSIGVENMAAGDGITLALTIKVTTQPTADFTRYAGLMASSGLTEGVIFGQNGPNSIRAGYLTAGGSQTATFGAISSTETTVVVRLRTVTSTSKFVDVWKQTTGRAVNTPEVSSAYNFVGLTLNTLFIRQAASDVIQIKDYVVWDRELTDLECANVADNLRGTLDAGAPAGTTIACTTGAATASGAAASIQGSVTIGASVGNASASGLSATITNSIPGVTVACAVGNAAAAGLTAAFGTFIQSDRLINNTGTLLPAQAVVWTWTPAGRTGSMAGITPIDGTGTTDANARLAPGIARAAGKLDIAVRAAAAVDDALYTEMFA